jgi:hypothetical protein
MALNTNRMTEVLIQRYCKQHFIKTNYRLADNMFYTGGLTFTIHKIEYLGQHHMLKIPAYNVHFFVEPKQLSGSEVLASIRNEMEIYFNIITYFMLTRPI